MPARIAVASGRLRLFFGVSAASTSSFDPICANSSGFWLLIGVLASLRAPIPGCV